MVTQEKTPTTPCRSGYYSPLVHSSLGCCHPAASTQVDASTSPFGANNHDGSNDASTPLSPLKSSQLNSNNRKRRGRPKGKSDKYADLPKRGPGRRRSISGANTNHANQHQFRSSPVDADIPSVGSPLARKRKFPYEQKCTGVFGGNSGAALYGVGRALVANGSKLIEWSKEEDGGASSFSSSDFAKSTLLLQPFNGMNVSRADASER